jgi:hypothetical protein
LAEVLAFGKALADLGASPAVQALVMNELARFAGISQTELDAAIAAQKDAPGSVG